MSLVDKDTPLPYSKRMENSYRPGDFLLVQGSGLFDRLIQFGQAFRFSPSYSSWNHVALIISEEGDLIEAINHGVKQTHISKYLRRVLNKKAKVLIVATNLSSEDRAEAVALAHASLSDGYGWTTVASTMFCFLFGLKFSFGFSGEDICSGLVAASLEHGGKIFDADARHICPAALAQRYIVPSTSSQIHLES